MTERSPDAVRERVMRILDSVSQAAVKAGRDPKEIRVMAVTKTQPPELVNEAIAAGITLLGENRAQELLSKREQYHLTGCELHFIGALQTNKVRQIIDKVSMVQSLDRLSLAQELERCAAARGITMEVLAELNIASEPTKSGILPDALEEFLGRMAEFPHLRVRGLMTIPPADGNDAEKEGYFDAIHRRFLDMKAKNMDNVSMDILSMGMSGDYHLAIRHGSSIVRIGRAMFGERL